MINRTDIHLVYWEEDRTELVTAEIKVELKWSNFTNLIPSLSDHSHGERQIHVQTWSMTNPGGTSIQLWFCSWNTAEPTGLSLKALLTPLPAHSGWLDKDIQKVAMIHWLIHHPSNQWLLFPLNACKNKHFFQLLTQIYLKKQIRNLISNFKKEGICGGASRKHGCGMLVICRMKRNPDKWLRWGKCHSKGLRLIKNTCCCWIWQKEAPCQIGLCEFNSI